MTNIFPWALEKRTQCLVLTCVFSMTLIVTPWESLDPINVPKFAILGTCGLAAIGHLAPYLKRMINSEARILIGACQSELERIRAGICSSQNEGIGPV